MKEELNELLELIETVKADNGNKEIELLGNKESFDKLREFGFDLNSVRHQELKFNDFGDSNIFIITVEPRQIKVYFE